MNPRRTSRWQRLSFLLWLTLGLAPGPARAIPVQIPEHHLSFTLPEGFEEMAPLTNDPDVVRLFVRRATPADEPNTWLSIRRRPASADGSPTHADGSLLGRYADRTAQGLDPEALQRLVTNALPMSESHAWLPGGAVPLQLDIRSRALQEQEMKDLLRAVLASAAPEPVEPAETTEPTASPPGGRVAPPPPRSTSGAMFLCLLLGAAVIVIAVGRR